MMSSPFRIISHIVEGSYTREYTRSLVNGNSQTPHLEFKQYIPLQNLNPKQGDVTIVAGHANGIAKEAYEPLWAEILARSTAEGYNIRAIWIADFYNQGESSVLNENILGNDPCWTDHARDLLHFINTHRHDMPQPLVGIGHSLGASQLVHLTTIHPALFKLLVFIEPGFHATNPGFKAAAPTLKRRDNWLSRQEAAKEFENSKFYGRWDSRCLDLFVKHGLKAKSVSDRSNPTKSGEVGVVLKTSKHQELATLMRPAEHVKGDVPVEDRFNRPEAIILFQRLPEIRPPILYLFGEDSGAWSGSKMEIVSISGTAPTGNGGQQAGQVETETIEGGTHFVPLEKVDKCADKIANFLGRRIRQWQEEEVRIQREWREKPRGEQVTANEKILSTINAKSREKL